MSKGHMAIVGPLGGGHTHEPRYKNPPKYEHVKDFGITSEPKYKLPILQPKKNSVSVVTPCPKPHFVFAYLAAT